MIRVADAIRAVAELRHEAGDDVVLFGSGTTWSPLLEAGLVDELHVPVGPALLAEGRSPYGDGARRAPRLLEVRRLPDSQLVLLRYDAAP